MATPFTAPGPEILKTPEAFLATMDLRVLLSAGRSPHDIASAEVEAVYQRHGLYGATRQALANFLYGEVQRQTLDGAPHRAISEATAVTLDRLRTLLGASLDA